MIHALRVRQPPQTLHPFPKQESERTRRTTTMVTSHGLKISRIQRTSSTSSSAEMAHSPPSVAKPPELFRFKCTDHRYTGDRISTYFKWNNSLVCQVTARFNHGYTGSTQVYLARRRVQPYNNSQVLHHRIIKYYYTRVLFHPS
jgi:hypothetical protein